MSQNAERWLGWYSANSQANRRLFCFPYGGGGAGAFKTWQAGFPATIEVCPVQLPGREERLSEPRFTRIDSLVEVLAESLAGLFDKPFAFFGHSLGAMIAFELARRLRREGVDQPVHLFVSGRRAPQVPDASPHIYDLPSPEFVEALRQRNYVRQEILARARLMEFMLPVMRADYEMVQTYSYRPESPFDFPITAFGGSEDTDESADMLEAWREQTKASFALHILPGDHYFVHSAQSSLQQIIAGHLNGES